MNLPSHPNSPSFNPRVRKHPTSNLAIYSSTRNGGIRKQTAPATITRHRSISTPQADRLHQLALEQSVDSDFASIAPTSNALNWLTPQHSPEPSLFQEPASLDQFPQWSVPTPPRSDSGVPSLSVDAGEEPPTTGVSSSGSFTFDQTTGPSEMSSLGFLLPAQYGNGMYGSEVNGYNVDQTYTPMRPQPSSSGQSIYSQTVSSSPALYQSRPVPSSMGSRRQSNLPPPSSDSVYHPGVRRMVSPYDSPASTDYSMPPHTQPIPSISGLTASPAGSPSLASTATGPMGPQYNLSMSRSPNVYDSTYYTPPLSSGPPPPQMYAPSSSLSYPPPFVGSTVNDPMAKQPNGDASIRVLNQRPKPQCWEHGCNGRQFSTFSNLLRHQREKSGTAAKSYCPKCGAEFTRTTARNGHLAHDKCTKARRPSEERTT